MKNSSKAQRSRLLQRLQDKPCSTLQARHELDIIAVAARIFELRHHYGFNIKTHWIDEINSSGARHRVAQYVLMTGKWQGGAHV